jgi:hypothetical protein
MVSLFGLLLRMRNPILVSGNSGCFDGNDLREYRVHHFVDKVSRVVFRSMCGELESFYMYES